MNYALIARIANLTDVNGLEKLDTENTMLYPSLIRERLLALFEKMDVIAQLAYGDFSPEYPDTLETTEDMNPIFYLDDNILALLRGKEKEPVHFEDYIFIAALVDTMLNHDLEFKTAINSYIKKEKDFILLDVQPYREEFLNKINKIHSDMSTIFKMYSKSEKRVSENLKFDLEHYVHYYKSLIKTDREGLIKRIDFDDFCDTIKWKQQSEFYEWNFEVLLGILNTQYYLLVDNLIHKASVFRSGLSDRRCIEVLNKHKKNLYLFIDNVNKALSDEFNECKSFYPNLFKNI